MRTVNPNNIICETGIQEYKQKGMPDTEDNKKSQNREKKVVSFVLGIPFQMQKYKLCQARKNTTTKPYSDVFDFYLTHSESKWVLYDE